MLSKMQGYQRFTGDIAGDAEISAPRPSDGERKKSSADFNIAAHGLRGLAAFMVLLAHILGGTAEHIYAHVPAYVEGIKAPWYLGTFGVELFFVISGFVILPSALRYMPREFALRRFLRLYPLFFVLSLLFVALNIVTNAYPKVNTAESVIAGLLFLNLFTGTEQLTPNAWSLTFEVMFYILMYGVVYATVHRRNAIGAAVAMVAAIAFVAAFPIAIYFAMGVAIRLASKQRWSIALNPRVLEGIFLAMTILFASQGHFEYVWSDFRHPVVVPIILSTGCYFYFAVMPDSLTARALDNRVMRYLGTVSYSLYLVHPYTYYGARGVFAKLGWFTDNIALSMTLFTAVVILLTMPLTHLVHVSLELWPYQRFFRQGIYRQKRQAVASGESVA